MATYWVGEGGNDSNDGTTYALRKLTTGAALALLTSKGDVLNVVGTVAMDNATYSLDGDTLTSGTSYNDPALTIRGTDSDGQPALATLEATAANYEFVTIRDMLQYVIIEGLKIDTSAVGNSVHYPIKCTGAGHSHVKLRYCHFLSDPSSSLYAQGVQANATYNVGQPSGIPEVRAEYCLFEAAYMAGDNSYRVAADHCIFRWVNDDLSGPPAFVRQDTNTTRRWPGVAMTNCTIDVRQNYPTPNTGRNFFTATDYINDATTDSRTLIINSNLFIHSATVAMSTNQLWNSGMFDSGNANTTGTWDHTLMGYNAFVFDSNYTDSITSDPLATIGFYEDHYHPDQPTTTTDSTKLHTGDVRLDNTTISEVINDATSAWTWVAINGSSYSLDLPRDYRVFTTTFTTGALDGGPVGAVEDAVNTAPVVVNPSTYTATAGVLKSVTAGDGLLTGATDADGDTLTATIVTQPDHGILVLNTTDGSFDFTPNLTYVGTDTFEFAADDGTTLSNTGTATINIGNNTPVGENKSYSMVENTQINFNSGIGLLRNATDADPGHTVSVTSMGTPSYGTLVSYNITTGSFVYRPNAFFAGTDTWTFKLTDGVTLTDPYTVTMRVIASGGTPAATYIDTAPFFRPTLEVRTEFRIKSTKNRRKHHDVSNYTDSKVWNESTHRVINVGVSTTVQVNLGGVAEAQYLMVETDNDVNVSINDTGRYWSVSKCAAVALGSIETVYLQNNSATNVAQVKLCVAD